MPSPIFNSMNGQRPQNRGMNVVKDYNQFQQNPFAFIMQRRGIDIPEDCRNNPKAAVEYLINSGNLTQSDIDGLIKTAQRMGIQLNF